MKKSSIIIVVILVAGIAWYLFLKPFDYLITFKANTSPGTLKQTIKTWGKINDIEILDQEDNYSLVQQKNYQDSTIIYDWKITGLNDSSSKVKVRIKDLDHSISNKVYIPFIETTLEKRSKRDLLDFNKLLNEHLKKFKVTVVGTEMIEPIYCSYISINETQEKKAFGMMRNFPYLSGFVDDNNLGIGGIPFVEITEWNAKTDKISYDFCYPIKPTDSILEHKDIKFKKFEGGKFLKAIYNGNYITSDRAWYSLLEYAKQNNIKVEDRPVEFFYDNPNMGGNELEWKAEIFMPIIEDE
jgi:effector-binding domain-containing protein